MAYIPILVYSMGILGSVDVEPKDKKGEAYVLFLKGGGVSIAIMRKFISLQRLRPR